ncbi:acyltransferase family protein [Stutzerimonas azotifigens]|uniref:acyltransferase family protein n=1 Tax=Stutzerimonas azotifigens TaxID=291995 RepID=UPI000411604A|nr:acyltransferase [Stutzerimonas azotifigens]
MQKMSFGVRENNFDFLRFLAASLVLVGHCYWLSGRLPEEPLRQLTGNTDVADLAVDVFFVISGFLVTASYLHGSGNVSFVVKRALRIFPGLAFSVMFALLIIGPLSTQLSLVEYFTHPQTAAFLTNLFMLTNYNLPGVFAGNPFPEAVNGSFWTLPLEGLMYCGVLFLGMFRLLRGDMVFVALAAAVVGYFMLLPALEIDSLTLTKLSRLSMFFLAGSALYICRNSIPWDGRIAVALLAGWLLALGNDGWFAVHVVTLPYLVIYFAYMPVPHLASFGRYGDFSYGMYIFGFPVQQLIMHWFGPHIGIPGFALLSLAITLCFAVLSWKLVEEPALRLKRLANLPHMRSAH